MLLRFKWLKSVTRFDDGSVLLAVKVTDTELLSVSWALEDVAAVDCSLATVPGESLQMGLQTTDAFEPCDDEVENPVSSKSKLKRGTNGGRLG